MATGVVAVGIFGRVTAMVATMPRRGLHGHSELGCRRHAHFSTTPMPTAMDVLAAGQSANPFALRSTERRPNPHPPIPGPMAR
jgi:hypothetical protein